MTAQILASHRDRVSRACLKAGNLHWWLHSLRGTATPARNKRDARVQPAVPVLGKLWENCRNRWEGRGRNPCDTCRAL